MIADIGNTRELLFFGDFNGRTGRLITK